MVYLFFSKFRDIQWYFSHPNKLNSSKLLLKWSASPTSVKNSNSFLFLYQVWVAVRSVYRCGYTVNSFREKYKGVNFTRVVRGSWEVVRDIVCQVMSDCRVLLCWKVFTSLKKKLWLNFGNGVFKWFSLG